MKKTSGESPEAFIDGSARIISKYINEKYGIEAGSIPTEALIAALESKGVSASVISGLRNAMDISDQVRFAGSGASQSDVQSVELGFEQLLSHGERLIKPEPDEK